eukprot:gene1620-33011_t
MTNREFGTRHLPAVKGGRRCSGAWLGLLAVFDAKHTFRWTQVSDPNSDARMHTMLRNMIAFYSLVQLKAGMEETNLRAWNPSTDDATAVVHPFLSLVLLETNHNLEDDVASGFQDNTDSAPGHDACAVCAKGPSGLAELIKCKACRRVVYCSKRHREQDSEVHKRVCVALQYIQVAESDVEVDEEKEADLVSHFLIEEDLQLRGSWTDVIPQHYRPVWSTLGSREAIRLSSLRADGPPKPSSSSWDVFQLAVHLAVATSIMSYPLTLLQQLQASSTSSFSRSSSVSSRRSSAGSSLCGESPPPCGISTPRCEAIYSVPTPALLIVCPARLQPFSLRALHVRRCEAIYRAVAAAEIEGRPLVVCILGASDTAELAQPQVWSSLGAACSMGVSLHFVGPEVPEEMHAQIRQPTASLQMTFWKGEYTSLSSAKQLGGESLSKSAKNKMDKHFPEPLSMFPDIFMGFNMGLTCPDYSWDPTLITIQRQYEVLCRSRSERGKFSCPPLPLIATTNTAAEALMEEELMEASGWKVAGRPSGNPFTSLEPLQSGTLGNDTYRKNAYVSCFYLRPRGLSQKSRSQTNGGKPKAAKRRRD